MNVLGEPIHIKAREGSQRSIVDPTQMGNEENVMAFDAFGLGTEVAQFNGPPSEFRHR